MLSKDNKHIFGVCKVGEKGQIVIPKEARELYQIKAGDSTEAVDSIRKVVDSDLYFFEANVDIAVMYVIVIASIAVLLGAYILINKLSARKREN